MTLGRSWSAIRSRKVRRFVFLFGGEGAVLHGVLDALGEAGGDGLGDVCFGSPGPGGDCFEGVPEGGLAEPAGAGGLGGELGHLIHARLVGLAALGVVPLQETGLLAAMAAGAVQGLKEFGYCHYVSLVETTPQTDGVHALLDLHLAVQFQILQSLLDIGCHVRGHGSIDLH